MLRNHACCCQLSSCNNEANLLSETAEERSAGFIQELIHELIHVHPCLTTVAEWSFLWNMVPYYSVSDSNGSHFMPGLISSVFHKAMGQKRNIQRDKRGKKEFGLGAVCDVPYWQLAEVKIHKVHLKTVHLTRESC